MSYSESDESQSDDFYRWYVGGSPPAADEWPRHAFELALQGISLKLQTEESAVTLNPAL